MTEHFDEFINHILHESGRKPRCTGATLPQLSDNPRYVFSRCAPNPYTAGYKRIYYVRRGEKLTLDKCNNDPRYGTSKYEECIIARRAHANRMRRRRRGKK
jgi:hypothetical protein